MYQIKFELFGKKMKVKLKANSKEDAEYRLRGKINIHEITECELPNKESLYNTQQDEEIFDNLKNVFRFD